MVSIRTALFIPFAVALSGCGLVEADPHRFERWAEGVATIPLSSEDAGLRPVLVSAETIGLRPANDLGPRTPMRIEVVEPEVLWEARADGFDYGLRGPVEAATAAVADAVVEQAVQRAPAAVEDVVRAAGRTVQLGAFSSRDAAEAAWARVAGDAALNGITPRYETVQRDGRTLVRLRAVVAEGAAAAACRAAGAGEFCTSTGQS